MPTETEEREAALDDAARIALEQRETADEISLLNEARGVASHQGKHTLVARLDQRIKGLEEKMRRLQLPLNAPDLRPEPAVEFAPTPAPQVHLAETHGGLEGVFEDLKSCVKRYQRGEAGKPRRKIYDVVSDFMDAELQRLAPKIYGKNYALCDGDEIKQLLQAPEIAELDDRARRWVAKHDKIDLLEII